MEPEGAGAVDPTGKSQLFTGLLRNTSTIIMTGKSLMLTLVFILMPHGGSFVADLLFIVACGDSVFIPCFVIQFSISF